MSHFTVTVAVTPKAGQDVEEALAELMAPFDENTSVPEYRDYETGAPTDHTIYHALKRASHDHGTGTGILPYRPDELGWSSASSKQTPEEQAAEIARRAALFAELPAEPTWADIVAMSTRLWPDDDDALLYEEESGRAYTLSTYNPDSKWDYWRVGGRWGGYFPTRNSDARAASSPWAPARDWDSPKEINRGWVDGGRRRDLDFDAKRAQFATRAENEYSLWEKLTGGLPEAEAWKAFAERAEKLATDTDDMEEKRAVWAAARKAYAEQPRMQALKGTDLDSPFGDCPIQTFSKPRALYVELARARAVPGFATLTHEGKWMAPGRMGWFGMSSDDPSSRIGYYEAANAYLETLDGDAYVFALDCHI